jgi:brefeldin A-inhibited guanine nucleotide-exchange protein
MAMRDLNTVDHKAMEPLLRAALLRIKRDCPRRSFSQGFALANQDLLSMVDSTLKRLATALEEEFEEEDKDADKYFDVLQKTLETKHVRLIETALDTISALIELGYLRGDVPQESSSPPDDGSTRQKTLLDTIIASVCQCNKDNDETIHEYVLACFTAIMESSHMEPHGLSLILLVRTCFHIFMVSRQSSIKESARQILMNICNMVFQRMEKIDALLELEDGERAKLTGCELIGAKSPEATEHSPSSSPFSVGSKSLTSDMKEEEKGLEGLTESDFCSLHHYNVYVLFQHFCNLSMTGHTEAADNSNDLQAVKMKILTLELLLHILQNAGNGFRKGKIFIRAIRAYLCVSLLRNFTSNVDTVTDLSLQIFGSLMDSFKNHLKSELEVFVNDFFLRILESEYSKFEHKMRVMEVFHGIIKEPIALVEIFVNYDCDLGESDLYRQLIDALAKIAKNPAVYHSNGSVLVSSKKWVQEEASIRSKCVESLVLVLKSLLSANEEQKKTSDSATNNDQRRDSLDGQRRDSLEGHLDGIEPFGSASLESFDDDSVGRILSEDGPEAGSLEVHDLKMRIQKEIENGIIQFNMSPRKGLAFLTGLGHVERTPSSVASFLMQYVDRLNKTAVGDYLGREKEYENGFCVQVLHEYVELLNFADMPFDQAIRLFVGGFRLPGEAQKIDRMMEKFAERYYIQNRDVFASADQAFILAFSTIMLQTNLHNTAIAADKKMTKEQFIKQNKGISPDGELSDEVLVNIYDNIQGRPILLADDEKKAAKNKNERMFSGGKRRQSLFDNERKELMRTGEAKFKAMQKQRRGSQNSFVRSLKSFGPYFKPMLEVAWPPVLGVFSELIETCGDIEVVKLCLEGFRLVIRLSCQIDLPTARKAYMHALAKFTTLDSVKVIQQKNIEAIRMLISVSLSEGDHLEHGWSQVLLCISQLARLHLFSSRSSSSEEDVSLGDMRDKSYRDGFSKIFSAPSKEETTRALEEANSSIIVQELDPRIIDAVYLNSQNLSPESLLYFVQCLCEVSLVEMSTSDANLMSGPKRTTNPRIFSLQKLVEVADYNMFVRSRLSWSEIWRHLAAHFTTVGLHQNQYVAMYGVDALRQLSFKFLQKGELSHFNFQKLFLQPFETIIRNTKMGEIQELVLVCVENILNACAQSMKSGWKIILQVVQLAAASEKEVVIKLASKVTNRLMTSDFKLIVHDFLDFVQCLVALAQNVHFEAESMTALVHLTDCVKELAKGTIHLETTAEDNAASMSNGVKKGASSKSKSNDKTNTAQLSENSRMFALWLPVLLGLSSIVADPRCKVRLQALDALQTVLLRYGKFFTPSSWLRIYKEVLFPMMKSAKRDRTEQMTALSPIESPDVPPNPMSWINSTAKLVLVSWLVIFRHFQLWETPDLMTAMVSAIERSMNEGIESLARIAFEAYSCFFLSPEEDKFQVSGFANEVSKGIYKSIASQLCLDYGHHGVLGFSTKIYPKFVIDAFKCCPVTRSRIFPSSASSTQYLNKQVTTPFGQGLISEIIPYKAGSMMSTRLRVKMSAWQATLYTLSDFNLAHPDESCDEFPFRDGTEFRFSDEGLSRYGITSMVLCLKFADLIKQLIFKYSWWSTQDFSCFLEGLALAHYHAMSFNNNIELRNKLTKAKFMSFEEYPGRLSNLYEQEVSTAGIILTVIFRLYTIGEKITPIYDLVGKWIREFSPRILNRFLRLDGASKSGNGSLKAIVFATELKAAYSKPVIALLAGLSNMERSQFLEHSSWSVPLLSDMIMCSDDTVRSAVRKVFVDHVNPLILSMVANTNNDSEAANTNNDN